MHTEYRNIQKDAGRCSSSMKHRTSPWTCWKRSACFRNLETNDAKLLQILLVGQTELDRVLSLDEMRQFRQRISIACRIENLTRAEVEEYILHRLAVAGKPRCPDPRGEAFNAVHEVTSGVPRQINTLCNFLLLTAFTEGTREVSAEMVRDIAAGLQSDKVPDPTAARKTAGRSDGTGATLPGRKRAASAALGVMLRTRKAVRRASPPRRGRRYERISGDGQKHRPPLLAMEKERRVSRRNAQTRSDIGSMSRNTGHEAAVRTTPVQQDIATITPRGPTAICPVSKIRETRSPAAAEAGRGRRGGKTGRIATVRSRTMSEPTRNGMRCSIRSRHEFVTSEQLRSGGIEVSFPRSPGKRRWSDRKKAIVCPALSG